MCCICSSVFLFYGIGYHKLREYFVIIGMAMVKGLPYIWPLLFQFHYEVEQLLHVIQPD